jgi:isocitrate lyase
LPPPQLAIARGLAYAPYADLIWCETSTPDIEEAREFAGGQLSLPQSDLSCLLTFWQLSEPFRLV